MRVAVIGAGAVGGALAALLDRAGHSVEVTARGAHLAAIRESGLQLTGAWGDHTAHVAAAETLTRTPELAILATKAQDSAQALRDNLAMLTRVALVVVQNGLDGMATARDIAVQSEVVGSLAMFASSYLSPGQITVTAPAPLYLGGATPENESTLRHLASVLDAVLPVSILPNFVGAQWTKLVVNQLNALPAITGLSVQQVTACPQLLRVLVASMRETVRVALRSGVRFEALQGLNERRLRLFALLPTPLARSMPVQIVARMGSTPNPGSTLQSIRRGQLTEIDFLNGSVVRAARTVGMNVPVNTALVELVHHVEHTGRFLTATEVVQRIARR